MDVPQDDILKDGNDGGKVPDAHVVRNKYLVPSILVIVSIFLIVIGLLIFNTQNEYEIDEDQIADNQAKKIEENYIESREVLSSSSGIQTSPLNAIAISQIERFGYIKTPTSGVAFVEFPWRVQKSYEAIQRYIAEENKTPEEIVRFYKDIPEADPATFEVFILREHVTPFAKDNNHFYIFGSIVPELDPSTVKIFKLGPQDRWSDISDGEKFVAIDTDTAYLLGKYGVNSSLQTPHPGILPDARPETLSIISDEPWLSIVLTDGERVYWDSQLLPGVDPQHVDIQKQQLIDTRNGQVFIDGKLQSEYVAPPQFGTKISRPGEFIPPTFIYNAREEYTEEFYTADGFYRVSTKVSEDTSRGGVVIYDAKTDTLIQTIEIPSILAGYDMVAVSPNGRYMYVIEGVWEFGNYSKLYQVEIATGAVKEIDGIRHMNTYSMLKNSSGLSKDGSKLIFVESSDQTYQSCMDANRAYDTIMSLDLSTGKAATLLLVQPSQHISEISWLPDESGFTYALEESLTVEYVREASLDVTPNVPMIMNGHKEFCRYSYASEVEGVQKNYYSFKF